MEHILISPGIHVQSPVSALRAFLEVLGFNGTPQKEGGCRALPSGFPVYGSFSMSSSQRDAWGAC